MKMSVMCLLEVLMKKDKPLKAPFNADHKFLVVFVNHITNPVL